MTRILEFGVTAGTLRLGTDGGGKLTYRDAEGRTYRMPVAGKTGTTQNWADAWTVGYTPYYTTAIWYGFDKPGNSLGINQTGAQLAGPVWGDYMREIHRGLPQRNFSRPSGIVDAAVCRSSGLLPTESCNQGTIFLPFLAGTVPSQYCDVHQGEGGAPHERRPLINTTTNMDFDTTFLEGLMPTLPEGLPELNIPAPASRGNQNTNTPAGRNTNQRNTPSTNQFLDDDLPAVVPRQEDDDDHLPRWDQLD